MFFFKFDDLMSYLSELNLITKTSDGFYLVNYTLNEEDESKIVIIYKQIDCILSYSDRKSDN